MKNRFAPVLLLAMSLFGLPVFSQTDTTAAKGTQTEKDTTLLGLPGDNLDLYAVLDLFQKSKTIEEFEKNLNLEKTGINNLDLNLDKKVDFIKVVTKKDGDDFTFVLQVDVAKKETQDVAVIIVSKDKDKKISMQIVGDKDLYGKDYIVELKESKTPPVTPNPGYTGTDTTIVVAAPATTTVVVVEQAPIVQYVYSPAYVAYAPPYYYGYYPPYYAAFTVMAVGMYWGAHAHYHGGYYGHGGYHGNTTVVRNTNVYNNYNGSRNTSNTVNHNRANGSYDRANNASGATRPSTGAGSGGANRPSTQPSNRPSTGAGGGGANRPSTQPSTGGSGATRPSTQPSTRPSGGDAGSGRPVNQPSTNNRGSSGDRSSGYNSSGSSRGSGGYSSGGSSRSSSYSGGGASRSGGYSGGGGSRGGGGGRGGGGRR